MCSAQVIGDRAAARQFADAVGVSGDESSPLATFLRALYGHAPEESFVEIRYRTRHGMGQDFRKADQLDEVATAIAQRAPYTDVYVGVLPRRRRRGRREDLFDNGQLVWADCDTRESVRALQRFSPVPSIIVHSGTGSNCHAYWVLTTAVSLDVIEDANRRIAIALGADTASVDAARILRPVSSLNYKRERPVPVRLKHYEEHVECRLGDIVAQLPTAVTSSTLRPTTLDVRCIASNDALLALAPQVYVERLANVAVPPSHKIHCPFHPDRTPSLHVYDEPERGWTCFGCHRGGTIYDFAALLWGTSTRGDDFRKLRTRLVCMFA